MTLGSNPFAVALGEEVKSPSAANLSGSETRDLCGSKTSLYYLLYARNNYYILQIDRIKQIKNLHDKVFI